VERPRFPTLFDNRMTWFTRQDLMAPFVAGCIGGCAEIDGCRKSSGLPLEKWSRFTP
jgi:hypothetical protein